MLYHHFSITCGGGFNNYNSPEKRHKNVQTENTGTID